MTVAEVAAGTGSTTKAGWVALLLFASVTGARPRRQPRLRRRARRQPRLEPAPRSPPFPQRYPTRADSSGSMRSAQPWRMS